MRIDPHNVPAAQVGPGEAWTAFAAWAVVGAGASLGMLSILTIGVAVLAVAALVAVVVYRWRGTLAEAYGTLCGVAVPLFYISYLNRGGPGEVCTTSAGGSSCTDEWNPWPTMVVGVVFVIGAVVAFIRHRRQAAGYRR